jgi:hypothetical protein
MAQFEVNVEFFAAEAAPTIDRSHRSGSSREFGLGNFQIEPLPWPDILLLDAISNQKA